MSRCGAIAIWVATYAIHSSQLGPQHGRRLPLGRVGKVSRLEQRLFGLAAAHDCGLNGWHPSDQQWPAPACASRVRPCYLGARALRCPNGGSRNAARGSGTRAAEQQPGARAAARARGGLSWGVQGGDDRSTGLSVCSDAQGADLQRSACSHQPCRAASPAAVARCRPPTLACTGRCCGSHMPVQQQCVPTAHVQHLQPG